MFPRYGVGDPQSLEKTAEREWKQFTLNPRLSKEDEGKYSGMWHMNNSSREDGPENLLLHPPCKLQYPTLRKKKLAEKIVEKKGKKERCQNVFHPPTKLFLDPP